MLATKEVQKAIYKVLTSYGIDVHSTLPINTKMPYVQFNNIQVIDKSNKSDKRQTYIVSLSAWCIDTTSIDIHDLTEKVLDIVDEPLDLGEKYTHEDTRLELVRFSQEITSIEIMQRASIELHIDVTKN